MKELPVWMCLILINHCKNLKGKLKKDYSTDGPDSSLKETILADIIEGLKSELSATTMDKIFVTNSSFHVK